MKILEGFFEKLRLLVSPTKCRVCGRPLFSKESRLRGVGPECDKGTKLQRERAELESKGQMRLFD